MIMPSVVSMAERRARTELRRVLAIFILVVERQPVQGENVEPSLGRKRVLEAAKHRGAVGSPAQAAGEAEKAVGSSGAVPDGLDFAPRRTSPDLGQLK